MHSNLEYDESNQMHKTWKLEVSFIKLEVSFIQNVRAPHCRRFLILLLINTK